MIFIYKIYTIGVNDDLDSIASDLGVEVSELRRINGFSNDYDVKLGEQIVIPAGNGNFTTYTVVKGDNLYSIARKYDITLRQLQLLNGFEDSEYIYPGEEIVVPRGNVKFYITEEGDDLKKVLNYFGINDNKLLENQNVYLLPNQLIVYRVS